MNRLDQAAGLDRLGQVLLKADRQRLLRVRNRRIGGHSNGRHTGVYELPFFARASGLSKAALGGWRVNAILTAQSGAPFTVNLGVDQANIGAGPAQRPDQLQDPRLPGGDRSPDRWFNTSAFALPAPFTFGSAPRNSVIGPEFANVDLAIAKTWRLAGRAQLEFRWESFNLFNRANFDVPNRFFGTPNFGGSSARRIRARCSSACAPHSKTLERQPWRPATARRSVPATSPARS